MRLVTLSIAASLALAGCGKEQATGNSTALDEAVTAEDFEANDVTAIDAATGADANMAADVDIEVAANQDSTESRPTSTAQRSSRPTPQANDSEPAAPPSDEPAAEPAGNDSDD